MRPLSAHKELLGESLQGLHVLLERRVPDLVVVRWTRAELEVLVLVLVVGVNGVVFADVVMVERRHCAGGPWNDAYPSVRIHHTSTCYGVNSRVLGTVR